MRRLMTIAVVTSTLTAALLLGPLGTAAAAPYVYGCSPISIVHPPATTEVTRLYIYNGSGSTANLTTRLLAFDGTNRSSVSAHAQVFAVPATKTEYMAWFTDVDTDPSFQNAYPIIARIVSDRPVAAGISLSLDAALTNFMCEYLHP